MDRFSNIEDGLELALKDIEHAKIEAANLLRRGGDGSPLLERLWDELDDIEDRIIAVRDDEEFQEALDDEEKWLDDMAARADAAS
jgi:hypothetical protein